MFGYVVIFMLLTNVFVYVLIYQNKQCPASPGIFRSNKYSLLARVYMSMYMLLLFIICLTTKKTVPSQYTSQLINQSTNQSINQSTYQPFNQSTIFVGEGGGGGRGDLLTGSLTFDARTRSNAFADKFWDCLGGCLGTV